MSAKEPTIQWFIARDGKQFGPVSELEMKKLVELGHLKAADLLWRPGFDDWKPAPIVFAPGGLESAGRAQPVRPADLNMALRGSAATESRAATGGRPAGVPPSGSNLDVRRAQADRRAVVEVSRYPVEDDDPVPAAARNGAAGRALAVAALLGLLGSGAYYAYLNRPHAAGSLEQAATPPSLAVAKASTPPGTSDDTGALDQKFQRIAMWGLIKREFPEWYGDRLKETARLTDDKQPDEAVTRHLVQALVTLRRQYSEQALAASSLKLKAVAEAFLADLKAHSSRSVDACYSFIAQGELSAASLDMLTNQDQAAPVQTQIAAVFDAISAGRKSPVAHNPPRKADYDVLANELSKLGWSQADLQLFADSKALAKTGPERVCKMVQDWFTAHIAITDPEAQDRLLVETLRPVVSG